MTRPSKMSLLAAVQGHLGMTSTSLSGCALQPCPTSASCGGGLARTFLPTPRLACSKQTKSLMMMETCSVGPCCMLVIDQFASQQICIPATCRTHLTACCQGPASCSPAQRSCRQALGRPASAATLPHLRHRHCAAAARPAYQEPVPVSQQRNIKSARYGKQKPGHVCV